MWDVLTVGTLMVEFTPTQVGATLDSGSPLVQYPSGSATIFGRGLARLGRKVAFVSAVGADPFGAWMKSTLESEGIDCSQVRVVEDQFTPLVFVDVDGRGRRRYLFYRFPNHCEPVAALTDKDLQQVPVEQARLFDFTEASVRSEPGRGPVLHLARRATQAGIATCFCLNYRPAAWRSPSDAVRIYREALQYATLAVMNVEEACLVTGIPDPEKASLHIADLGPQWVAVTNGERGGWVCAQGQVTPFAAFPVEFAYDVGAGDTFHAGLLDAYLEGRTPPEACRWAAGVVRLKLTQGDPNFFAFRQQVQDFLAQHGPHS